MLRQAVTVALALVIGLAFFNSGVEAAPPDATGIDDFDGTWICVTDDDADDDTDECAEIGTSQALAGSITVWTKKNGKQVIGKMSVPAGNVYTAWWCNEDFSACDKVGGTIAHNGKFHFALDVPAIAFWVSVVNHGNPIPGTINEQINAPNGGCQAIFENGTGPNECALVDIQIQ